MPRTIPHYVKSLDRELPSKKAYKAHLQNYLQHNSRNIVLTDENLNIDLFDFIERYCDKKDHLKEKFDLENCHIEIRCSDEGTECFFIVDNLDCVLCEQISIHNCGNPPKPLDNFKRLFKEIIRPLKEQKRIALCNENNLSIFDWDLYHTGPTTHELVLMFLSENNISENNLENVISDNNQGNEIPEFKNEYRHLKQEILDFYQQKLDTLIVQLRKRKL